MNLYKKLLEIQKEVIGLSKDNKAFGYEYVSGTKILSVVKPLMNKYGILLKQEVISIENTRQEHFTKSSVKNLGRLKTELESNIETLKPLIKTSEILSKVMMKFTWVDCETGEKDENLFGANGMNTFDKGVGSALTYAERYFLLKFFHIATDEDDIDKPLPFIPEENFKDYKKWNEKNIIALRKKYRFTPKQEELIKKNQSNEK